MNAISSFPHEAQKLSRSYITDLNNFLFSACFFLCFMSNFVILKCILKNPFSHPGPGGRHRGSRYRARPAPWEAPAGARGLAECVQLAFHCCLQEQLSSTAQVFTADLRAQTTDSHPSRTCPEKQHQTVKCPNWVYLVESSLKFQKACVPDQGFSGFPEQGLGGEQSKGAPACL